ncbi:alpha-glucosidase [Cellulosimicrobium arenosum]|uniref:Alpha-glucosidase n=1 Tax=Cellulosimicrobium arenosum TaxID=2708133 RepID=A0A927PG98_9MICO|nr:alpha-glucosidase [Cellulosimicrobium arenosum]MBD8080446.1 alpha-glucosidase [Cellulosimicrobium arenosum]
MTGQQTVPDDGPRGGSPGATSPGGAPWWTRAVVYQVYPRSFQDTDGDGIGDLPGITRRLDHLGRLGVDVVWLSPVYRSPQADNGYDISDYEDVDPLFGSLADLDALVAGLHERGIKLVMDLVVNHTSDEHPWFRESATGPDSPRRDWYWWRPARPGMEPGTPGAEPTNWRSFFGGSAWAFDAASREYYLHLFDPRQPDLNWENPEVREAVYAMMRRWLDRGVDGFRMDVINLISKAVAPDGSLPDGEVHWGAYGDGGPHYTDGPRVHEYLAEMHREVVAPYLAQGREVLTVGETPGVTVEHGVRYTDPARREVDMVFQFEHMGVDHGVTRYDPRPWRLADLKATLGRWQAGLAERGWNALYWDNHDQPRVVSRFGDDSPEHRVASAKALAVLLHLHRGTPYLYQGEELGMTNAHFTRIEQYQDVESLGYYRELTGRTGGPRLRTDDEMLAVLAHASRDHARTPVQWDATPAAGFTTGQPWLEVNPNHTEINAGAAWADEDSVLHLYRRLVALRHEIPVVALGDFRMLLPDHDAIYAFTRALDAPSAADGGETEGERGRRRDELLVLVNVSGSRQDVPGEVVSGWEDADVLVATHGPTDGIAPDDAGPGSGVGHRVLRPWEAVVLRRRDEASHTQV